MEKPKSGKYFCSILYEYEVKTPEQVTPTPETTLGLKYSGGQGRAGKDRKGLMSRKS